LFDRYDAGEQAVLVHIYFSQDKDMEDLQEFESLVSSAGVEAMQVITGSRKAPHPKYFVGEGKAVEIADAVKATGASVVLFDHALTPAQERNLERLCECRVIDRTGLILDIFAQRARTHEGKLQVELAQLRHLATRLVRGWTHLERQKGGIGLRGPGETQLETDRRFCVIVLPRSSRVSNALRSSVNRDVVPARKRTSQRCRWWAIPTPVNPPCLIR
jgi:GTP-binding protein HflX